MPAGRDRIAWFDEEDELYAKVRCNMYSVPSLRIDPSTSARKVSASRDTSELRADR